MAGRSFILFAGLDRWSIATWPATDAMPVDILFAENSNPEEIAAAVFSALQKLGYTGGAVAIGIPSAWCLSASISTTDLPRNDPKAMLYRLEENLPLAAESVIADFVSRDESALGVCIKTTAIAPLVDAHEALGVTVQSIFPTVLATAQGLTHSISQSPCLLLCAELAASVPQLNVISLEDGRPIHWDLVPATPGDLKLQLELLSTEFGSIPHIEAINIDDDLADTLVEACSQVINIKQESGAFVAAAFAAEVLKGRAKPWIEFRRDQLAMGDPLRQHRKWIDSAIAAAILCLLSLTLAFWVRAHRYHQVEQNSTSEMVAAFQQHFPGWDTPINVRAVVDAQYRRAVGSTDTVSPQAGRGSALSTLHDVLLPMMAQDHFQIERMAFHQSAFEISGKLQSYEQVDALSKMARAGGMVVAPAQTRKDSDGTWTFSLSGSRAPNPAVN